MGGDVAAPLGHSVDLALLHVVAGFDEDVGKNVACEDRALTAYAGEKYVDDLGSYRPWPTSHAFPGTIDSNLQTWAQSPQPGHWVRFIETVPFLFLPSLVTPSASDQLMAGHPRSRQALHPLHLSTSTV